MGNVICSLRRRLFAVLALAVSLAGVLLADVFVDLTVDPPEVLEDWPCVSDCRRDASGISFAIDDASCDLAFAFLGLPEDAEVCYLLHAGGQVVSSGYGTALPLADHPDADRVEFFSPDGSADWGAVTSVRAERAEIRPSGRAPYASAAAASADGPRLAEDRPGLAAGPRATHVVDGARAVAEEAGFDYREPGVWTDPDWEGLDRPAKWLTVLTGFSGSIRIGRACSRRDCPATRIFRLAAARIASARTTTPRLRSARWGCRPLTANTASVGGTRSPLRWKRPASCP